MKLHLGCGHNLLEGWVNIDGWRIPPKPGCEFIEHDLTKGIPQPDNSVDLIFTEHFLEHIEREEAVVLLRDCRRALKPGGVMRIVVPDLGYLVQKYVANDLNWGGEGGWQPKDRCTMLNQGMRSWGHRHLYDHDDMVRLLDEAGFKDFPPVPWRVSKTPELHALEVRPQHGDLRFEALKS